jgi:hypothetical protein
VPRSTVGDARKVGTSRARTSRRLSKLGRQGSSTPSRLMRPCVGRRPTRRAVASRARAPSPPGFSLP